VKWRSFVQKSIFAFPKQTGKQIAINVRTIHFVRFREYFLSLQLESQRRIIAIPLFRVFRLSDIVKMMKREIADNI